MWGSKETWDWLNQFGVLCTIGGTALALVTFVYVGKVRVLLLKKDRVPAVYADIVKLLPVIRSGLKSWDDSKEEVIHLFYEVRGHLQNIRPSLGSKEKAAVDKIIAMLTYKRGLLSLKTPEMTRQEGWVISRHMTEFEVMLGGLKQDNEVTRI